MKTTLRMQIKTGAFVLALRPFVLAACLILAALGPPATQLSRASQGRGSPPVPVSGSFIVPGGSVPSCDFDVEVSFSGLAGRIDLG